MKLHFETALVRRLLEASINATEREPTYDQLYDPAFRKDGKAPPEDAFPTADDADRTKIPAGLIYVGDQGLYLASNAHPNLRKEPPGTGILVAFAREADPNKVAFDSWWMVKQEAFGGDDGTFFLPRELVEAMLANDKDGWCHFKSTPDSVAIPKPPNPRRPKRV